VPCPSPPHVYSSNSVTFVEGQPGAFEVWGSTGSQQFAGTYSTIFETGSLPPGMTWTSPSPTPACPADKTAYGGCLSAQLAGTPQAGSAGVYPVQLPTDYANMTLTITVLPPSTSVSSFTPPDTLNGDPFTVTFSDPVKGVTSE